MGHLFDCLFVCIRFVSSICDGYPNPTFNNQCIDKSIDLRLSSSKGILWENYVDHVDILEN